MTKRPRKRKAKRKPTRGRLKPDCAAEAYLYYRQARKDRSKMLFLMKGLRDPDATDAKVEAVVETFFSDLESHIAIAKDYDLQRKKRKIDFSRNLPDDEFIRSFPQQPNWRELERLVLGMLREFPKKKAPKRDRLASMCIGYMMDLEPSFSLFYAKEKAYLEDIEYCRDSFPESVGFKHIQLPKKPFMKCYAELKKIYTETWSAGEGETVDMVGFAISDFNRYFVKRIHVAVLGAFITAKNKGFMKGVPLMEGFFVGVVEHDGMEIRVPYAELPDDPAEFDWGKY